MKIKNRSFLTEFKVNDTYIIGVYQGSLSEFDILIKYRQKLPNGKWTRIRTLKHIHWAVDLLIKLNEKEEESKKFIDFLIEYWKNVKGFKTNEERENALSDSNLLTLIESEAAKYKDLANIGEYSIKFLILIAKLLMLQEKTNKSDAYMFGSLLNALKEHESIFKIVSVASHNRR